METSDDYELLTPPHLSICCIHFIILNSDEVCVDKVNANILQQLNDSSKFMLSARQLYWRPVLRVSICGYTTNAEHMEKLVTLICKIVSKTACN